MQGGGIGGRMMPQYVWYSLVSRASFLVDPGYSHHSQPFFFFDVWL